MNISNAHEAAWKASQTGKKQEGNSSKKTEKQPICDRQAENGMRATETSPACLLFTLSIPISVVGTFGEPPSRLRGPSRNAHGPSPSVFFLPRGCPFRDVLLRCDATWRHFRDA
jgi:hypothetical protein